MNEPKQNDRIEEIHDHDLSHVTGGLNPQPLPPRVFKIGDPYISVQNVNLSLVAALGSF